jgi:hypothetical protein
MQHTSIRPHLRRNTLRNLLMHRSILPLDTRLVPISVRGGRVDARGADGAREDFGEDRLDGGVLGV